MSKKIRKAVFPVGGLGTRFLPANKALPKEMLPVASKPLIHHAFEEAVRAGIEEFIFITGRNKNIITNHFDCVYELEKFLDTKDRKDALSLTRDWVPKPGQIAFIRQQNPLGLGHAVWCARNLIMDEPFAVILADELFISDLSESLLSEMVSAYDKTPGNIIAVADIPIEKSNQYGIIKPSDDNGTTMKILDMVEKPAAAVAPSNISIVGRYILDSSIFEELARTPSGVAGEIQLTDAIKNTIANISSYGYRFQGKRFDCGNQLGFLQANVEFALRDPHYGEQAKEYIKKLAMEIK